MQRIFLAVSVFLAMTLTAAADEWKKDYAISAKPEVHLSTGDGSVEFTSWDRKQVSVAVYTEGWQINPDGVRIEEHQSGDRVDIEIHIPHSGWFCLLCGHRSLHVNVNLPRDANLDLHTGDGSIKGSRLHGTIYLNTGDGSIHVEDADGQLSAHSGDGGIEIDGRFDALKIETGDGGIRADINRGSKMAASWYMHSGDGSIDVRLPEDFSANLDARTGDGSIQSDLASLSDTDKRRNSLRGKLNGGGPLLELRSGDGSIHLRKN
ncbi:MAG TPA: DUF4097 family beta strand repeat-containing protein [Terriglobales bacterium]|nr:DUF4097 family beta strand repeat-containing protein [Terriglobales bacterium]